MLRFLSSENSVKNKIYRLSVSRRLFALANIGIKTRPIIEKMLQSMFLLHSAKKRCK
jgi:hypothetical protein